MFEIGGGWYGGYLGGCLGGVLSIGGFYILLSFGVIGYAPICIGYGLSYYGFCLMGVIGRTLLTGAYSSGGG